MNDLDYPPGPEGSAIASADYTPVTSAADFEPRRSSRFPTARSPNPGLKVLAQSNAAAMSSVKDASEFPDSRQGDNVDAVAHPKDSTEAQNIEVPSFQKPERTLGKRKSSTAAVKKTSAPRAHTTTTGKSTKAKTKEPSTKTAVKKASNEMAQESMKFQASDELPHNLGKFPGTLHTDKASEASPGSSDKENKGLKAPGSANLSAEVQDSDAGSTTVSVKQDPDEAVKPAATPIKKPRTSYGLKTGETPFPTFKRPTAAQCEEVNQLLTQTHGQVTAPKTIPEPSLTVTGCGEVPSVLDALIRTVLSANTTGNNSGLAFAGLVTRFGTLTEGIGKGSVNWDAVRRASLDDVFQAIARGGMGNIKSKTLKTLLDQVYEDNQKRMKDLDSKDSSADAEEPNMLRQTEIMEHEKEYRHACADQHFLSLDHIHKLSTPNALAALVKYPGIGPKTAACVCLFCLQRPCFAVDTHIFRLCKWLGWIPDKASEVTAFSHLEVRIPNHLKYSLHSLLIKHGKTCPRCRAATGENSVNWDQGCPIEHLVKRTGARKGGLAPKKKSRTVPKTGEKRKRTTTTPSAAKTKKRRASVSTATATTPRKNPTRGASAQTKVLKETSPSDGGDSSSHSSPTAVEPSVINTAAPIESSDQAASSSSPSTPTSKQRPSRTTQVKKETTTRKPSTRKSQTKKTGRTRSTKG
jgi:DNA-(apurinic or apyrimidinic site) lyase